MAHFSVLPPEINSLRMYLGAGSAPMLQAMRTSIAPAASASRAPVFEAPSAVPAPTAMRARSAS